MVECKSDYFHQLNQQILVPIKDCHICFMLPRYVPLFLAGPVTPH